MVNYETNLYTLNEIPDCGRNNYKVKGLSITTCFNREQLYARAKEVHMVLTNAAKSINHYNKKAKRPLLLLGVLIEGFTLQGFNKDSIAPKMKRDIEGCISTYNKCNEQLNQIKSIAIDNNYSEIINFLKHF